MNVLILGSGGREHCFAWKIAQSRLYHSIFIAPGNAGTSEIGTNVPIQVTEFEKIAEFIRLNQIHLVLVGPEEPLVNGIHDYLKSFPEFKSLIIIGPKKEGAQLEGSKDFSKQFMKRHHIPSAKHQTFTANSFEEGMKYILQQNLPIVLKADGLAAGKGVVIAQNYEEAIKNFEEMVLNQKFGVASSKVVVEEFLNGIELSVFVLTDGNSYIILPEAKDYKRIGENDTGLNTGGMGAISPVPFANDGFLKLVENQVVIPTIEGLKKDGIDYSGFIFIGLMNVNGSPYVIEYNVRMGDPETEAVLPRIKSDFLELLIAVGENKLKKHNLEIDQRVASTVILVSGGYPEKYEKGNEILGLKEKMDSLVFHAGTEKKDNQTVTNGGRVLALTGIGNSMQDALNNAYSTANKICWKDIYFRKDIGFDL